jgi:hypothetical protein
MPLFQKDPEKEKAREEAQAAKEEARKARKFQQSSQGLARAAREAAQLFFQVALPISHTDRTVASLLSGDVSTKTRAESGQTNVLESIKAEGWRLEHAGYIFQETGSVSRDKLLSSSQAAD